ncbi:lamin-B2-like [Styela clava]
MRCNWVESANERGNVIQTLARSVISISPAGGGKIADGLEHDNSVLEGKLKDASKRLRAKEAQTGNALKERDDAVAQLDSFKAKVNDLAQELETTRKTLESETLRRIEYQNKLQSLQEDLQFKEKLWKEYVRESRRRHDVSVTEIDKKIKVDYESRLEAAIADLRDQQNYEIDQMRDDLEGQYKAKIQRVHRR